MLYYVYSVLPYDLNNLKIHIKMIKQRDLTSQRFSNFSVYEKLIKIRFY